MDFYAKAKRFLESIGYEYLGNEGWFIFYRNREDGKVYPIDEEVLARKMSEYYTWKDVEE